MCWTTYCGLKINTYLLQYLLDNLVSLALFFRSVHIINSIIHHLLPLIHDIVFALKFHSNALKLR